MTRNAKMAEFYCDEQLDLAQPYFEKFFDELVLQKGCKQFQLFFTCLLPVMDAKMDHVKRLEQILESTPPPSDKVFTETIADGIGLLKKAY